MYKEEFILIDQAVAGDKKALEKLLDSIMDMVFNLSLRMLGTPYDAEDASQEIYIRIITGLSSFKKESAFSTWVYRIASNHLLNYKKSMFAKMQKLSFEFYGKDIEAGFIENTTVDLGGVDEEILSKELKMSCTNVMLQCFDPESRLIYVMGVMFEADSKVCGEILGITPEAYRKRLSRIREKMSDFMKEYCGLAKSKKCDCKKRVAYAIQSHRLNPSNLEYSSFKEDESAYRYLQAMEELDEQSLIFAQLPKYRSPDTIKQFMKRILHSDDMTVIMQSKA